jgi:hypothetical protein
VGDCEGARGGGRSAGGPLANSNAPPNARARPPLGARRGRGATSALFDSFRRLLPPLSPQAVAAADEIIGERATKRPELEARLAELRAREEQLKAQQRELVRPAADLPRAPRAERAPWPLFFGHESVGRGVAAGLALGARGRRRACAPGALPRGCGLLAPGPARMRAARAAPRAGRCEHPPRSHLTLPFPCAAARKHHLRPPPPPRPPAPGPPPQTEQHQSHLQYGEEALRTKGELQAASTAAKRLAQQARAAVAPAVVAFAVVAAGGRPAAYFPSRPGCSGGGGGGGGGGMHEQRPRVPKGAAVAVP